MVIVCFIHAKRNKYLYLQDNTIMSTANQLFIWLLQIVLAGLPFRILQKFLGHAKNIGWEICEWSCTVSPLGLQGPVFPRDPAVWGRALPRRMPPRSHTGRSAFSRNPCAGCSSRHIRWTELCLGAGSPTSSFFYYQNKGRFPLVLSK